MKTFACLLTLIVAASGFAQDAAKSRVDEVIEAVKAHVADEEIIASLRKEDRPIDLSLNDKTRLKSAGVSDGVIKTMQDPSAPSGPQAVATPKAEDYGSSLEGTMQFIQDALNAQGKVVFATTSMRADRSVIRSVRIEDTILKVKAGPKACRLSITEINDPVGTTPGDGSPDRVDGASILSFKGVEKLRVLSRADDWNKINAPPAGDGTTVKDDPGVFVLNIQMLEGSEAVSLDNDGVGPASVVTLILRDAPMAQRMATAIAHGVELCGGSKGTF